MKLERIRVKICNLFNKKNKIKKNSFHNWAFSLNQLKIWVTKVLYQPTEARSILDNKKNLRWLPLWAFVQVCEMCAGVWPCVRTTSNKGAVAVLPEYVTASLRPQGKRRRLLKAWNIELSYRRVSSLPPAPIVMTPFSAQSQLQWIGIWSLGVPEKI